MCERPRIPRHLFARGEAGPYVVTPVPTLVRFEYETAKRKVSVSLDEDLVEELKREDPCLSAQVNQALRAELERRRRDRLLVEPLDRLDTEHGPVDESLVEKYVGLLR